ncbi:hypothetical protein [Paraburkholderia fungorum]|uniref:Uncharacterized protein n=1 Tax=Paraburkholderia fungorum TaxID=134537 RepID=A0A3R7HNA6_9BURK|nr:hypothetical protein [Paraburkholderia fungorum]RKF43950.1 hypothetical protein BCY88_29695 [Paraburkholderia fungorum]
MTERISDSDPTSPFEKAAAETPLRQPDGGSRPSTPPSMPAELEALREFRAAGGSRGDASAATFRAARSPQSAENPPVSALSRRSGYGPLPFIPVSYSIRSNTVIAQSLDGSNVDIAVYHDASNRIDGCAVLEIRSEGAYAAGRAPLTKVIVDAVNAYGLHPGNGFVLINDRPSISQTPDALEGAVGEALASLGYRELQARAVRFPRPVTRDMIDGVQVAGTPPRGLDAAQAADGPRTLLHGHQSLWRKPPDILFAPHGRLPRGQAGEAFHVPLDAYFVRGAIHADGHVMSAHEIVYRVVSSGAYRYGQPLAFYAEPDGALSQEHIDRLVEDLADVTQVPLMHIREVRAKRSPGPPGAAFEVIAGGYGRSITPESDLRRPSSHGLGVLENFGREKVAFKGAAIDRLWGEPVVVTIQRTPNGSSFIRSPDQIVEAKRRIQALGYPVERIRRTGNIFGRPAWIAEEQAVIFDSKSNHRPGSKESPVLNAQTLAHLQYIRALAAESGDELVDVQMGIRRDGAAVLRDTGLASLTGVHGSGRGVDALLDTVETETRLGIAKRGET